ncbi:MAG: hypothetical protein EBW98_07060, partial [Actinobacteria bacterium]|nr:hypothetical protein [Actinomycetota bacterium]
MKRRFTIALCVVALCSPAGVVSARGAQDGSTSDGNSQDSGSTATPEARTVPLISPNITETRRFTPLLPRKSGEGRRVVYSNSLQWVWVVDKNENVIRSMPVSGRRGVPTPGEYAVTTKSPWSFSLDFEGVTFRW